MQTICGGDYASVSPVNIVKMAAVAERTQEKESITMTMLCVVFIVLFYVSMFLLCLVMYPKLPEEAAGDEESGNPLPPAERYVKDGVRMRTEVCVICMEDFKRNDVVRVLKKCEHVFHVTCIDSWCTYRLACPICRTPFRLFNAW